MTTKIYDALSNPLSPISERQVQISLDKLMIDSALLSIKKQRKTDAFHYLSAVYALRFSESRKNDFYRLLTKYDARLPRIFSKYLNSHTFPNKPSSRNLL